MNAAVTEGGKKKILEETTRGYINPNTPTTKDLWISEQTEHNKTVGIFVIIVSYLGSSVRQILDCFIPEVTFIKIMFAVYST